VYDRPHTRNPTTNILDICVSENKLFRSISAALRTRKFRNNFSKTHKRLVCMSSGLYERVCVVCVVCVCVCV